MYKYTTKQRDKRIILVSEAVAPYEGHKYESPEQMAKLIDTTTELTEHTEEHVYCFCFDTVLHALGYFEASHGTVDASFCNPREIFQKALLAGASRIVLAHNHPSGDTHFSAVDEKATRKVREAGKIIGVELIDHFVFGDGYVSARSECPWMFE